MGSMTDKIIDYLKDLGYDKFLIPSDYKINRYIKSENLILIIIRYIIRKLSFKFNKKINWLFYPL